MTKIYRVKLSELKKVIREISKARFAKLLEPIPRSSEYNVDGSFDFDDLLTKIYASRPLSIKSVEKTISMFAKRNNIDTKEIDKAMGTYLEGINYYSESGEEELDKVQEILMAIYA